MSHSAHLYLGQVRAVLGDFIIDAMPPGETWRVHYDDVFLTVP